MCNHQTEMFVRVCNSSLPEAHTGSADKISSPRILVSPNHQEAQTNESCEVLKIQGNADRILCSDMNELKASDALTGLVVIFMSIYSYIFCLLASICSENGAFDDKIDTCI